MIKKQKSPVRYEAPALEKGLDILELLAGTTRSMYLSQISQAVGRGRSEIYRVLQVLERRGYLERSQVDDYYSLSNHLFLLGMERPTVKGLLEKALPLMHRLSDDIQQSCHLVVPSDEFMVVIARVESPKELGLVVRVGHRRPLLEATSGLVLVANQPEDIRAHWIQKYGGSVHRQTRGTIIDTIESIRKQGYAAIPSTVVPGVVDISTPVSRGSAAAAALTVPFMKLAGIRATQEKVTAALRGTAEEISRSLR